MSTVQKFEDLEIWQLARVLNQKIYQFIICEPFASDFRLKDQMRRSSGSIMDNIAEGFERGSRPKLINSLATVKGEIGELKSQLYRALDNHYLHRKKI
ncbi:MAG TPA: four helix bundle protein [Flavitalea sp.]|nr:four helix bundle protein [Flavitalea sp.]